MKRILTVFGTRPEAIKMAPVVKELQKFPELFETSVCVTAQHREMLDQVLSAFEISPDYDLDLMAHARDLFDITAGVLLMIKEVMTEVRPDVVLVHGDTATTMAASIAAYYHKIPVGHVEAGLRSFKKHAPFPEEINRRITGCIADIHFAPTNTARENLLKEGASKNSIWVTGNTVIDALFETVRRFNRIPSLQEDVSRSFEFLDPEKKLILVTGHRRENFGDGLENICLALKEIAQTRPDVEIIYPVHLNPNVKETVHGIIGQECGNIYLIPPVDYLPFVYLMGRSHIIITDSGGMQEEAPSMGKPVLVMRETTERPEALEAGTAVLVGTDRRKIVANVNRLLDDETAYNAMALAHNPYGDGKAAERIVQVLQTI